MCWVKVLGEGCIVYGTYRERFGVVVGSTWLVSDVLLLLCLFWRGFQWACGGFKFVQWADVCGLADSCRFEVLQFFRQAGKKCGSVL